ncbi:hypothetical protein MAUB1S_11396 [Mycolicibacterium aubagnense]
MRRTRLALARLCVLIAMRLLDSESYWAFERLWWVNDSLKMHLKKPGES